MIQAKYEKEVNPKYKSNTAFSLKEGTIPNKLLGPTNKEHRKLHRHQRPVVGYDPHSVVQYWNHINVANDRFGDSHRKTAQLDAPYLRLSKHNVQLIALTGKLRP